MIAKIAGIEICAIRNQILAIFGNPGDFGKSPPVDALCSELKAFS